MGEQFIHRRCGIGEFYSSVEMMNTHIIKSQKHSTQTVRRMRSEEDFD